MFERALPGFTPEYTRTEITAAPGGYWDVRHAAAQGPGFVSRASVDEYLGLTWAEAMDLLGAIYDGYTPSTTERGRSSS